MPHSARPRLLILGCSTRAAAWSAVRAGFFPVCADDFGDADLHQVAEVLPQSPIAADAVHPEFAPTVAAHLVLSDEHPWWRAESRSLHPSPGLRLGCSPDAHSRLHDASVFTAILKSSGLPALEVLCDVRRPPPSEGTWLQKPRRSGGGRGIRRWTEDARARPLREDSVFQKYQPGEPCAALFLARRDAAELIGITRQLIGDAAASPPWPFGYCGSIGPAPLPETGRAALERIAAALVTNTGACGLFGIDFIWDGTTPWVVEVNPRYTASCEILELVQRRALLTEHWRACLPGGDPPPEPLPVESRCGAATPVLGKLIVYARQPVVAPDFSRFLHARSPWSVPYLADIPHPGTQFDCGQPICTVFASGGDVTECHVKLVRRARWVRRWLGEPV